MQYRAATFSSLYAIGQISLGLLLHPYQTLQSVVQEKVFVWLVLLPTGVLAIATLIWRFLVVPLVRLIFSCQTTSPFACSLLPLFSDWLTFFCIYWQLLLLYLMFRFTSAFKE